MEGWLWRLGFLSATALSYWICFFIKGDMEHIESSDTGTEEDNTLLEEWNISYRTITYHSLRCKTYRRRCSLPRPTRCTLYQLSQWKNSIRARDLDSCRSPDRNYPIRWALPTWPMSPCVRIRQTRQHFPDSVSLGVPYLMYTKMRWINSYTFCEVNTNQNMYMNLEL